MSKWEVYIDGFKLTPYVRMTRRGKFIKKRAQDYIENQIALAKLFKYLGQGKPPKPARIRYSVHYTDRRRRDKDNIEKAILDALQRAGIIEDDSTEFIAASGDSRIWMGSNANRIIVILDEVEKGNYIEADN